MSHIPLTNDIILNLSTDPKGCLESKAALIMQPKEEQLRLMLMLIKERKKEICSLNFVDL